jgi:hypothetical protein
VQEEPEVREEWAGQLEGAEAEPEQEAEAEEAEAEVDKVRI